MFTSHSTWLKPLALVFHSHPIHGHAHCCLSVLFLLTFYFLLYLSLLLFFMANTDSMINTLCNSADGTFVTLDEYLPDTGYEPNAMELTDVMEFAVTTELNDAASSDINFQDSLDYTAPSSDLYIDDDALGKLLAEVHRDYAYYRRAEGVSVSPSSVSVGRSNGGTCGKER